jgi:GTPase SAR1 family protein
MVEKHKIVLLGDGGVGKSCITIQVSDSRTFKKEL